MPVQFDAGLYSSDQQSGASAFVYSGVQLAGSIKDENTVASNPFVSPQSRVEIALQAYGISLQNGDKPNWRQIETIVEGFKSERRTSPVSSKYAYVCDLPDCGKEQRGPYEFKVSLASPSPSQY